VKALAHLRRRFTRPPEPVRAIVSPVTALSTSASEPSPATQWSAA